MRHEILGKNSKKEQRKYFLGMCQQSTLEKWTLCSPELTMKRKHKCKFKLRQNKFPSRVHRRFCDLRIMINNKDCICEPTIYGDDMLKVKGKSSNLPFNFRF
ncbi:hypothetical protein NQ314_004399 [Rhamnusium bicolor]|uniref:Uncharacterized protein n=1 Tax=Rhamnusium bicolor TaxID=1586634 RepID=A0AAV8ZJH9_9CUCU|nr:hypothetical protein NQ314_004399 [Rhamnusium bicolor]